MTDVEIKNTISEMLKIFGISDIIMVDDEFSDKVERPALAAAIIGSSQKSEIMEKFNLNSDEDILLIQLGKLDDSKAREIYNIAADGSENVYKIEAFLNKIPLKKYSLSQWKQKDKNFTDEQKSKTLFIFDKDFSSESVGNENSGIEEIKNLCENNCICALYTHTITQDNIYSEWLKISNDNNLNKSRFIPISKQEEGMSLLVSLRLCLLNKHSECLKRNIINHIKNSISIAENKIDSLTVFDFEHVVFYLSRREGTFEIHTLLRLYELAQREKIFADLWQDQEICDSISKIRQVPDLNIEKVNERCEAVLQLQRQHHYDNTINKYYAPLASGDIFEAGRKNFLLLYQPCDLLIRGKDGRRSFSKNKRFTVPLILIKEENKETGKDYLIELPYYSDDVEKKYFVNLKDIYYVEVEYLDLCMLNNMGKCEITIPCPDCPSEILPSCKKYYNHIIDKMKCFSDFINGTTISDEKTRIDFFNQTIMNKFINTFPIKLKYDPKTKILGTGLTRIKRLSKQDTDDLLYRFVNIKGRIAKEMDLAITNVNDPV